MLRVVTTCVASEKYLNEIELNAAKTMCFNLIKITFYIFKEKFKWPFLFYNFCEIIFIRKNCDSCVILCYVYMHSPKIKKKLQHDDKDYNWRLTTITTKSVSQSIILYVNIREILIYFLTFLFTWITTLYVWWCWYFSISWCWWWSTHQTHFNLWFVVSSFVFLLFSLTRRCVHTVCISFILEYTRVLKYTFSPHIHTTNIGQQQNVTLPYYDLVLV